MTTYAEPAVHDLTDDAALAARLVISAALLADRTRAQHLDITTKTHHADVVTQADTAAEAFIVEQLATERPLDGLVGEEGASRSSNSGRTWVIDPVDGTYNFARGHDRWCSAIALIDTNDEPLLGAIYHLPTNRLFLGGPNLASTLNGAPLAVVDAPLNEACLISDRPRGCGDAYSTHQSIIRGAATVRSTGSTSLELADIAAGHADVLVKREVHAWDRLPGQAIVLGVGGAAIHFEALGSTWTVIGAPQSVADALEIIQSA